MLPREVLITNEYGCTCTNRGRMMFVLYCFFSPARTTSTTRRRCAFPGVNIVSQYWLVAHGTSSPRWPLIIEADVFTGFYNWWSTIRVTLDEHRPSQYEELEQQTPYFRSSLGCDLCYGFLARRAICWGCHCCSIGSISHEHCFFHLCNLQFFDLMERGSPPKNVPWWAAPSPRASFH